MKSTEKIFKQLKANPIAVEPLGLGEISDLPQPFIFPKFQKGEYVKGVDVKGYGVITYLDWNSSKKCYRYIVRFSGDEYYAEEALIKISEKEKKKAYNCRGFFPKFERGDYVAFEDLTKQPNDIPDDTFIPKVYNIRQIDESKIDLELFFANVNFNLTDTGVKVKMTLPQDSLKVIDEVTGHWLCLKSKFKRELLFAISPDNEFCISFFSEPLHAKLVGRGFFLRKMSFEYVKCICKNEYISASYNFAEKSCWFSTFVSFDDEQRKRLFQSKSHSFDNEKDFFDQISIYENQITAKCFK